MEPVFALLVPIGDLGAEGKGGVGAEEGFAGVGGVVGVRVGADLGEDAVGLLDEALVDGVGVGGGEVDADCAAEDEDGDEAAEYGDLDVVEGLLDLPATWGDWAGSSVRGGEGGGTGATSLVS